MENQEQKLPAQIHIHSSNEPVTLEQITAEIKEIKVTLELIDEFVQTILKTQDVTTKAIKGIVLEMKDGSDSMGTKIH